MIDERAIEARLAAVLGEPMAVRQRAALDGWVKAMLESAAEPRRRFRIHVTRSTALAVGMALLLATVFGVWGAMRSTEAPYGLQSAAQYQAEVDAAKAVTPLPPGATWPTWLGAPPDTNASYGVLGGLRIVEFNAACFWFEYWLVQHAGGDPAGQAAATAGVLQTSEWRTFTDPGLGDTNFRELYGSLIAAAKNEDSGAIRDFVAVNCREVQM